MSREEATDIARTAAAEVARLALNYMQPADPVGPPPDGKPWHYNNGWAFATMQAPYKPPGALVDDVTLRNLSQYCDQLRSVILHLTREVNAVPVQVVPRQAKDKTDETRRRCDEAQAWLDDDDGGMGGVGSRRQHFEAQCIDDLCVIGAAAIFYQCNRRGELTEVYSIDSATIRPRVDVFGWDLEIPYEQWVYGVLSKGFKREEMTYDGIYPISYSPYFQSPTAYLLSVVDTTLSSGQWNKLWLDEGTGGSEVYAVPADWTPEQVMGWQKYWDAMKAGNLRARQRTSWVPSGTTKLNDHSRKDQDFQEFDLFLLRRVCAIFGVQPASLGYAGEQYKVSQEKSLNSTTQFGTGALLDWRRAQYDKILCRLGYRDLRAQDVSGEEESEDARAKRLSVLVAGGIKTPNEARAIEGDDPMEGGDTLFLPSTLQPLEHALIAPPDPLEMLKAKASMAPTGGASGEGAPDKPTPASSDTKTETRRMLADWERLALKRLASGKDALLYRGLPDPLTERVYSGLVNCHTEQDVRAVFRGVNSSELMRED